MRTHIPSLLLLGLTCCHSPQEALVEQEQSLTKQWQAVVDQPTVERQLSYAEAQKLCAGNPIYRESWEQRLERAEAAHKQVYRDLLPRIRFGVSFREQLEALDTAKWSDWELDLSGHWLFRGLLNLREDLYLAELNLVRTRLVHAEEQRRRELRLHELYNALYRVQSRGKNLESLTARLAIAPSEPRESLQSSLRRRRLENEQESNRLNLALAELLGTGPTHWVVEGPAPTFPPELVSAPLDAAQFGILRRKLWAVDIATAAARAKGMALEKWPQLNVTVTSGPLVSLNAADAGWFEGDRATVRSRITIPIDLSGRIYRNARESAEDLALLQANLNASQTHLIAELRSLRTAIELNTTALDEERERLKLLTTIRTHASDLSRFETEHSLLLQNERVEALETAQERLFLRLWMHYAPAWDENPLTTTLTHSPE